MMRRTNLNSCCNNAVSLYTGKGTVVLILTLISSPGAISTSLPFLYKDAHNPIVPPIAAPPATVYPWDAIAASTPTYTITTDPATGNITAITYHGTTSNNYERQTTISEGVTVPTNVKGNDVFGSYLYTSATAMATGTEVFGTTKTSTTDTNGQVTTVTKTVINNGNGTVTTNTTTATGLFGDLMTLSTALGANDTTTINSCINGLSTDLGTVTSNNTKLAAVSNRLEMTDGTLDETVTNLKSYRSELQDADLTEVLTDLATQENALKATYSVTSQLLSKTTLLDYL